MAQPHAVPAAEGRAKPVLRLQYGGGTSEAELVARYRRDGDLAARAELVRRYLPLARSLASRFRYTGESPEDLTQVANLALLRAVDRYDPERGTSLAAYAAPTIVGELKHHLRGSWSVHVPRGAQERAMQVTKASSAFSASFGRSPRPAELADELKMSPERVLEALEAAAAYDAMSLDAPQGSGDEGGASVVDGLGHEEAGYALVEHVAALGPALAKLPARERLLLQLRFGEDLTQTQIAQRVGLSQMHVSRLIRRAIDQVSREVDA